MPQEVTTQSWGSRLKNAFFGIIIGIILILGALYFIFWNEGSGLHTAQSLQQTMKALINVRTTPIYPENNLKVVYFSGIATTNEILKDDILNISSQAIRLTRIVQMFQWQENVTTSTQDNMGGSQTTTKNYSYNQTWSTSLIDSSEFHDQSGHQNPTQMPITSNTQQANVVTVGDFQLSADLVHKMSGATAVDLSKVDLNALQTQLHKPISLLNNTMLYAGNNAQEPQIGDLRIQVTEVLPQTVSVIGQQMGNTIQAYMAPAGKSIALLALGLESPFEMIHKAEVENQINTWLIRLGTLVAMVLGFSMILQPIVVLVDVVPILGRIAGFGTGAIAFICGLSLWAVATAIAWFAVRPLISVILIAIVAGIIWLIFKRKKRSAPVT